MKYWIIIGLFVGFMIGRPVAEYVLYKYNEHREYKAWVEFHNKYSPKEIYDMVITTGTITKEQ